MCGLRFQPTNQPTNHASQPTQSTTSKPPEFHVPYIADRKIRESVFHRPLCRRGCAARGSSASWQPSGSGREIPKGLLHLRVRPLEKKEEEQKRIFWRAVRDSLESQQAKHKTPFKFRPSVLQEALIFSGQSAFSKEGSPGAE